MRLATHGRSAATAADAATSPVVGVAAYLPGRRDLAELLGLGLPVAAVQIGIIAMGLVDTLMVGRVSSAGLAAVAMGHLYFFSVAVLGMGVLYALDPVIAQAVGARDEVAVSRGIQRGLVLAGALSLLVMVVLVPAGPVLHALRQPEDIVPSAEAYARGLIAGIFPFYGFIVLRQCLQAMTHVKAILVTVIAANFVNAFLNWVLIYGNLGAPALGAVGSAWATSASRWFMLGSLLAVGWPILGRHLRVFRRDALAVAPLLRLIRLGAPVGVQQWLEFGVFGAAGLLMGLLGAVALAGHQIALQMATLTFMVAVGVAQATSVLVGQAVGRGDPNAARRAAGGGVLVGVGFMALTALMFLTLPGPLASAFTEDPEVVDAVMLLLPIAGVFQVFDGLQVVASGALRGVGDTRVPMLVNLVGFWLVGLPISVALGFGLGAGLQGIWWGLAIGIAVVAALLAVRIPRRFGGDLRRLVIDGEAGAA